MSVVDEIKQKVDIVEARPANRKTAALRTLIRGCVRFIKTHGRPVFLRISGNANVALLWGLRDGRGYFHVCDEKGQC